MMDLYIYYRVREEDAEALRIQVEAMQQDLFAEYAIVTGLKRRPQPKDGRQTWMEIYQAVPEEFEAALSGAVSAARLPALIDGPRHTEYFVDVTSCV